MTTLTPEEMVSRLRVHAATEKAAQRPPMPPEPLPDDTPPTLAESCRYCGTNPTTTVPCGVDCRNCGAPVEYEPEGPWWRVTDGVWRHVHGPAEGTDCQSPRPVPREAVKL